MNDGQTPLTFSMSQIRQTHTFVVLDLSEAAYQEIRRKLEDAGYQHAFMQSDGRAVIDMAGIAVAAIEPERAQTVAKRRRRTT
jgi:hypothetical protein